MQDGGKIKRIEKRVFIIIVKLVDHEVVVYIFNKMFRVTAIMISGDESFKSKSLQM